MDIRIRPYRPDDVERLYEAARESIPAMQPWMPWCHAAYTLDEARTWVEARPQQWDVGTEYSFVIESAEGHFWGGCGINQINPLHRSANLGYWLRLSRRRRGVTTSAVRLLVDWTFRETDIDRIEIVAAVGNIPSQRVAEKVGAMREGVRRQGLLLNRHRHDAVVFSILRSDWDTAK
jgi:ribosomal-protein-serine acetyltransferase